MRRPLCFRRTRGGTYVPAPAPTPTPTPTPSPSGSPDINTLLEFTNAKGSIAAGHVTTVAAGLDLGAIDLSSNPRNLGSNPARFVAFNPAGTKWKFTGTGDQSALKLDGWKGISLEGFEARHANEASISTYYYLISWLNSQYCKLVDAYVHGDTSYAQLTGHSAVGCHFGGGDHLTIQRTKFEHLKDEALYLLNNTNASVLDNYCTAMDSDFCRPDVTTAQSGLLIKGNLVTNPKPTRQAGGAPYGDHPDGVQIYGATGTVDDVTIQDNAFLCWNNERRMQGFYMNSDGWTGSNIRVLSNLFAGTLFSAIHAAAASGTFLIDGNTVYGQDLVGTGETSDPVVRLVQTNAALTISNHNGHLYQDPYGTGATFTAGSGNTNSSLSLTKTATEIQALEASFRATHPNVPS